VRDGGKAAEAGGEEWARRHDRGVGQGGGSSCPFLTACFRRLAPIPHSCPLRMTACLPLHLTWVSDYLTFLIFGCLTISDFLTFGFLACLASFRFGFLAFWLRISGFVAFSKTMMTMIGYGDNDDGHDDDDNDDDDNNNDNEDDNDDFNNNDNDNNNNNSSNKNNNNNKHDHNN
jgi:hypothetical protein